MRWAPRGTRTRRTWGGLFLGLAAASGCGDLAFGGDTSASADGGGTGILDDDDDGAPPGDCCSAHPGPGCENPIVSSCVCLGDAGCCEQSWDPQCVDEVTSLGCGICEASGSCCEASASPGCVNPAVEACVCSVDPYCCGDGWDAQCVADVFLFECGLCTGASSCCVSDGEPGCDDPDVQQCVCAVDETCCTEGWDFQCVQQVDTLGCGGCGEFDTDLVTTGGPDSSSSTGTGTGSGSSSTTEFSTEFSTGPSPRNRATSADVEPPTTAP